MGETQRRKVEIDRLKREYADWLETLTQTEREVALVAKRAHERIIEGRMFSMSQCNISLLSAEFNPCM